MWCTGRSERREDFFDSGDGPDIIPMISRNIASGTQVITANTTGLLPNPGLRMYTHALSSFAAVFLSCMLCYP